MRLCRVRGQPTAECPFVCPSKRRLVTRCELRPAQGGAEDTKERVLAMMVYGMLSLMTLWLRLIQACERVRLLRLPREACFDEFQ